MNIQEFIKAKIKEFEKIIDGIDKDETEYNNGWWETSSGAEFGLNKKIELKHFLSQSLLEYNEKIKRDLLQDLDHEECAKCYIERKLTNLTQDTNPKE